MTFCGPGAEGGLQVIRAAEQVHIAVFALPGNPVSAFVTGFLFMLPKIGVENAKLHGLWENAPAQATDLTAVYWDE